MSTALAFQTTAFDVIDRHNQPWLRSNQIGLALNYKNPDLSISKLFRQHAEEFTDSMTAVITLPTPGGPQETRIFSLRGCHLLAMFARTPVAKAFRVWVLDVLETLNKAQERPALDTSSRLSTRQDPERKELAAMINAWVGCAPLSHAAARSIVNAHFGVKSVDEMTVEQCKEAVVFIRGKVAEGSRALPAPTALALPSPAPEPDANETYAIMREDLRIIIGLTRELKRNMQLWGAQNGYVSHYALLKKISRQVDKTLDPLLQAFDGLNEANRLVLLLINQGGQDF